MPKKAAAKTRKKASITARKSASVSKSGAGKSVQFLQKPTCTSCRNARAYMEKKGFELHFRDLDKQRLSAAELEQLIGDRDHKDFLNTRNEVYRAKNMKQNPPNRAEAIRMMAETPNLIRRPVIIAGGRIVLGFDQNGIDSI